MKIYVNGYETELDDAVAYAAYMEVSHKFDMEEVRYILEGVLDNIEVEDPDEIINNDKLVSEIATRYRYYMDNQESGDLEYECAKYAYERVMAEKINFD